jgi:hypothetical protein
LKQPDSDILKVFQRVRAEVVKASGGNLAECIAFARIAAENAVR